MQLLLKRFYIQNTVVKPLLLMGLVALLFVFSRIIPMHDSHSLFEHEISIIVNQDVRLDTDVSSTNNERIIGLSKYTKLQKHQAMLFVFQEQGYYPFWMKNMKFPIDIIWLDEEKKIVFIKEYADPLDYPQSYNPESVSLYVLETVAGFATEHQLFIGQELFW
jgi:hypothetical protein